MAASIGNAAAAASLVLAQAAQAPLTGRVVGPDQHPVAGAVVEVTCGEVHARTSADDGGRFVGPRAPGVCLVRATAPGFAPAERRCSADRPGRDCSIVLALAPRRESLEVLAPVVTLSLAATGGATSAHWSADQLRALGPDVSAWLAVAALSAGAAPGTRQVRQDGLSVAVVPPSRVVSAVRVNEDPFGVQTGGTTTQWVDLESAPLTSWTLAVQPPRLLAQRSEPLTGSPAPRTSTFGITGGAVAAPGLSLLASLHRADDRSTPTYVTGAPGREKLAASLPVALRTTSVYLTSTLERGTWTATYRLTQLALRSDRTGIGGAAGPGLAYSVDRSAWGHRVSLTRTGPRVRWRAGVAADRRRSDDHSLATGPSRLIAGRLLDGAPDRLATHRIESTSFVKVSAESTAPGGWLVGAEAGRHGVRESRMHNPHGQIWLATDGSQLGVAAPRPDLSLASSEPAAALYGERRLAASRRLWLRGGLRFDWQSGLGVAVAPRLSFALPLGRFIVAGNAGVFRDGWAPDVDLELRARQRAPVWWTGDAAPVQVRWWPVRRRDVAVRGSVTRVIGRWQTAIQQTWRWGRGPGGLVRTLVGGGPVDILDARRTLRQRESHARVDWSAGTWVVTGHYVHTRAMDDGLGGLEPPAWRDERGEWAPTSGVARHRWSLTARGIAPGGVWTVATYSWLSGVPYTMATGSDDEGLRTFAGRLDARRNAHVTPSSQTLSLAAARRWRLPVGRASVDAGINAEHLVGGQTVLEVDTLASSALAGRPILAVRGPRLSVWVTLVR